MRRLLALLFNVLLASFAEQSLWAGVVVRPSGVHGPVNFQWTSADKSAFFKEFNLQLDALLSRGERHALEIRDIVPHLKSNLRNGSATVPQLTARRALAEALGRPKDMDQITASLRKDTVSSRGEYAAAQMERLARNFPGRDSPSGRWALRQLAILRHNLMPAKRDNGLSEINGDIKRTLAFAFDGASPSPQDLPPEAVRAEVADRRYGTFNQMDERLRPLGFFRQDKPEHNQLCGPVCLLNAALKLDKRMRGKAASPLRELVKIINDVSPKSGYPTEKLLENGIWPSELARLIREYLARRGMRAKVGLLEPPQITPRLLMSAADDDTVLIAQYGIYKKAPKGHGMRIGGHWVLVSGFQRPIDRNQPLRIMLQNPAQGEEIARLKQVWVDRHPSISPPGKTYAIDFEDPKHLKSLKRGQTREMESVIKIRLGD